MTTPGDAIPQAASATPDARGPGPAGLTSTADRKRREAERLERKRAADALRQAQKRAAAKSPTPVAGPSRDESLPSLAPVRTDEDRRKDSATFLQTLYGVADFVAGFLGYQVTPLKDGEASEDAPYLVPLARRFLWFDTLITWAGTLRVVTRLKSHVKPKVVAPPAEKKEGDVVQLRRPEEQAK